MTLVTRQAFVAMWCLLFLDFIELYFLQSDCVLILERFSECTIVIVGPRYLDRMSLWETVEIHKGINFSPNLSQMFQGHFDVDV